MTIKAKSLCELMLCGSKNPQFLIKTGHFGTSPDKSRGRDTQ